MARSRARTRAEEFGPARGRGTGPRFLMDPLLSRRTELVLRELGGLPTLPAVAARLLQLGAQEEPDLREIVRLIEADPTLTARLLSLCRRAANRTRHPITTVEMAVVMLGLDAVRSLVLSVAIFDWSGNLPRKASAKASPAPNAGFNRVGFWQHSIAVACAAELIAKEMPEPGLHAEECFVCGLVHDIGKLALEVVLPRAYGRVIDLTEMRMGNIADFERPILGMDHHVAGAHIAKLWGLPEALSATVELHGTPYDQLPEIDSRRVVGIVGVADALCRRLGLGWSGNMATAPDDRDLAARMGLNADRIEGLIARLYEATSARCRDLGLGEEPSQQLLVESILRANGRLGRLNQELGEANRALGEAQQQLAETRAMVRLGEMTAGAAHELNNPLTVISGRAQSLLSRLRDDYDRQTAQAIVDAAGRLSDLVARLHRIANPPRPDWRPADLATVMDDVIKRAKARCVGKAGPSGVLGIKLTLADGLDTARLDAGLMTDAIVEIVVNAVEASPRSPVEVRVQEDAQEPSRLLIHVIDDGAGMSEHALEHAVDPFFSEKPAGRQPGLGLALAHRLVGLHGGEIQLASRPGRGTSVTVALPDYRWSRDPSANQLLRGGAQVIASGDGVQRAA
mgnify:CR=1 FL=1